MNEILIFGLIATVVVVVVAGLLNRLLDFDDLPVAGDGDPWQPSR